MEDAIYNGVKILFPEKQQIHNKFEMQILKIIGRKKCTKKKKKMTKKEIILDKYGKRRSILYEYGPAESLDKTEFCAKLN